jgi:hypothetical protein
MPGHGKWRASDSPNCSLPLGNSAAKDFLVPSRPSLSFVRIFDPSSVSLIYFFYGMIAYRGLKDLKRLSTLPIRGRLTRFDLSTRISLMARYLVIVRTESKKWRKDLIFRKDLLGSTIIC